MEINKLIMAGCSVSDYTQVDRCFGDNLSEMLGFKYIHRAAGCGSNDRTIRVITSMVLSGEIKQNDLVLIQYTNIHRKEFFSKFRRTEETGFFPSDGKATTLRERYDSGDTIKFKLGASEWQPEEVEKDFFNLYEQNFISEKYDTEVFINRHYSLLALLEKYNIKTLFILVDGYLTADMEDTDIKKFFKSFTNTGKQITYTNISSFFDRQDNCLEKLPIPPSHFSEKGHYEVANYLYEIVN